MNDANTKELTPELQGALNALRRAAKRAREEAIRTNTDLIRVIDGKVVPVTPEELRAERDRETEAP